MDSDVLDALAHALAPRLVPLLLEQLGQTEMVDQAHSPLGRRRHIAAVRQLLAKGDPRAAKVGRKYLLRRDALDDVLRELGRPREDDGERELMRELRLVDGGRR